MKNLCLVAVWLVASALVVQAQVPPVAIGVLTDMIGPSKDMAGPGAVTAVQMAVEDFGGSVLNRPVTVFSGDHQLKPDVGAGIARRWYDDGVDLIVDVPVSAVGLAVQAVSKEKRRLFITSGTLRTLPASSARLFRCNGPSTPPRSPTRPRWPRCSGG